MQHCNRISGPKEPIGPTVFFIQDTFEIKLGMRMIPVLIKLYHLSEKQQHHDGDAGL